MFTGFATGKVAANLKYKRLEQKFRAIPKYEAPENISPAEFAFLLTGRVSKKAIVGELIYMHMKGFIKLSNSNIEPIKIGSLSVHQRILLNELSISSYKYKNWHPFEYRLKLGLVNKGLIKKIVTRRSIFRDVSSEFRHQAQLVIFMIVLSVVAVVIVLATNSDVANPPGSTYFAVTIVVLSVVIFLTFLYVFYFVAKEYFRAANGISNNTTEDYGISWQEFRSVLYYMKFTGMDTMTPNYDSMDFSGLDPLYPYAVAIGLDKQIVSRLLKVLKIMSN